MTSVADQVIAGLDLPVTRQLERSELIRLVEHVAFRRELWAPHLDVTATGRTYASLHRDANVDVWAIFWRPENDTGWHDHDTSSGAVHVIDGSLEEHALLVARPERRVRYAGGTSFSFDPSHIHRLTCAEPVSTPSTTTARCIASRSPTRTSCGRSRRPPFSLPRPDRRACRPPPPVRS
jgi:hypothetical protein